ncbi:MAG TPA: DUF1934 domain-containing protein [Candidatus Intestinimonas pullistercoris]|uniref:DUF1934 domain-containing protein n=1 Tax=Candidatus Intestinimonas pullistercoris TaxID=2838623 RepID=A0A9D2P097_9FIRM|nr:DUF1934 domain-containing protein [uncultured Intestinimonas sp.]HJC41732.1 DUF1934 domain-containing protein [Candidatus Intestinimonas pullistercoris]
MDKSVIISIRGVQTLNDDPPEVIELVTEGRLMDCGDAGYTLSYQESEITGLEGTLTTFQVEPDCITLMRMGEFNSQMVFQPGRRHFSMYDTPYGALSIGVNTKKMRADLDENGGEIEIDYAIEIDHAVAGENTFRIDVREKGPAIRQ